MIEFDASFGLYAIVLAAIIDELMIDEKRLFDYTQMSMRADGLYYTVFLMSSRPVGSLGDSYQKTLQRPLSLWGDCPTASPYGSATARNCGNVQVIVQKDHRMRLSFLREQLIRSSEQLVLVDTNKGFLGPVTRSNAQPLCDS